MTPRTAGSRTKRGYALSERARLSSILLGIHGSRRQHPVGDLLENLGRGHFFITAGQIGKHGFINAAQLRELHERGHVIGSHSYSHPTRMSLCDDEILADEWARSVEMLSELLGEKVDTASVPGGYYSRRVAEAAAAAGIRILFNSEPTTRITVSGTALYPAGLRS